MAFGDILVINYGIDREVGFHPVLVADGGDVAQIVESEIHTRTRTHVQPLHTEIYRVSTGIDCRMQALVAPHRSHYLKIFPFHNRKVTQKPRHLEHRRC